MSQSPKDGMVEMNIGREVKNIGSFVFNVEIVFYYALICCFPGGNTCCVRVGVEFISTCILRAKTSFAPTRDHPLETPENRPDSWG